MKLSFTVIFLVLVSHCSAKEPVCSTFDYEEKVLKKLIRLEFDQERMKLEVDKSLKKIESLSGDVKSSMNDFNVNIAESIKRVKENVSDVLAGLEEKFSALEQRMRTTFDEQQKKLDENAADRKSVATVAFMSHNPNKGKPLPGETIVYKTTLMNHGGGYDNTTGVFMAPAGGIYSFTTQFCIQAGGKYIYYRIMYNDKPIQRSLIYDKDSDFCSSVDAVIVLKASDRVWVECLRTSSTRTLLNEDSETWNTFSGVMIHE